MNSRLPERVRQPELRHPSPTNVKMSAQVAQVPVRFAFCVFINFPEAAIPRGSAAGLRSFISPRRCARATKVHAQPDRDDSNESCARGKAGAW